MLLQSRGFQRLADARGECDLSTPEAQFVHTRRIKMRARACALFTCPFGHFGRHTAPGGASRLLDRACIAPIHGVCHDRGAIRRPLPPPIHGPTYAQTGFKHRPIHDRHTRMATGMRGWALAFGPRATLARRRRSGSQGRIRLRGPSPAPSAVSPQSLPNRHSTASAAAGLQRNAAIAIDIAAVLRRFHRSTV